LDLWCVLAGEGQPVATLIVLVVAVVMVLLVSILMYSGLVRRRNQVDDAWSQIDGQLKRWYDLSLNLVETVEGYTNHERGTLEEVTEARTRAMDARVRRTRARPRTRSPAR
jgi:LemA protein